MRSQLPTLELDAVFEAKEELAVDVKNALTDIMTDYGYQIMQVGHSINPDQVFGTTSKSNKSLTLFHRFSLQTSIPIRR
jgi:hypothetical protein